MRQANAKLEARNDKMIHERSIAEHQLQEALVNRQKVEMENTFLQEEKGMYAICYKAHIPRLIMLRLFH